MIFMNFAVRLGFLTAVLFAVGVLYLGMGSYSISFTEILNIFLGGGSEDARMVILDIRLPRLLGAVCTGAALSLCGAVMQSIFNNPLVSPDILGVSSGAACGASVALICGCGSAAVFACAFGFGISAVLAAVLITAIAGSEHGSLLVLVLAGIVVSAFFSGIVEMICAFNPRADEFPSILFFLFGSMTRITFDDLLILAPVLGIASFLLWKMGYALDVISLGEDDAARLGVPAVRLRYAVIAVCSIICGVYIAKVGMIGWIGLIIPHMARMIIGVRHRMLIPSSMILGALFLLGVDLLCRNLFTYEIPVGIVTSLIGAPVFVLILCRNFGRLHRARV